MDKMHIINVGDKGTFKPTKTYSTSPEEVDAMIENMRQKGASKITLYFHGGLVNEEDGMEGAEFMNGHLKEADTYPVSFVWETGWGETIKERIFTINKTTLFKKLLKFVLKRAGSKLGLGVGTKGFMQFSDAEIEAELNGDGAPFAHIDQLTDNRSALMNDTENEEDYILELEAELTIDVHNDDEFMEIIEDLDLEEDLLNEGVIQSKSADGSRGVLSLAKFLKGLARVAFRVIKRYLKERDHGFYCTVFEEVLRELYIANLGAWLWDGMKTKAGEMWLSNAGLQGDKQHPGTYLLERLNNYASTQPLQIDLLGHSAGSIAICHILKTVDENYGNLTVRNVLLLAPACQSTLFLKEVVNKPNRFEKFRMFTMTDEAESEDALIDKLPRVYPRSLLYLISGILEDEGKSFDEPILGMERYYKWASYTGNFPELKQVSEFLAGGQHRVVLSPTSGNPPGLNSMSRDHGYFNEDKETLDSIKHIIKNS